MRTGLMATKLGMTQMFADDGTQIAVSVLQVSPHTVLGVRQKDTNGYTAVQVGCGDVRPNKVTKPLKGHFEKIGQAPKRHIKEFRVDDRNMLAVGEGVDVSFFKEGQYIDVSGKTIGKGFAGVMKRHNFGGLRASHGVSVSHRSHGSTGNRQDPGKVFKNKKMAGHMGCRQITKQNLYVQKIDSEKGLIFVKGAVPGAKGALLSIHDAVKKRSSHEV